MRRLMFAACLVGCTASGAMAQTAAPATASVVDLASDRNFVVFFPEWSAAIDDAAHRVVMASVKTAMANPRDPIVVTGYADPTGSARANALISALRTEQVFNALIDAGIPESRIQRVALGGTSFVINPLESRRVTIAVGSK